MSLGRRQHDILKVHWINEEKKNLSPGSRNEPRICGDHGFGLSAGRDTGADLADGRRCAEIRKRGRVGP